MVVLSFRVKKDSKNYVFNVSYNKTLQHYDISSAGINENNNITDTPVPLALFNRVFESTDDAIIASQQWARDIEITKGRV